MRLLAVTPFHTFLFSTPLSLLPVHSRNPSHPSTLPSPLPLSPSFILYRTPYSLTWSYSPSNTNTPPLISPCSKHSFTLDNFEKNNYRSPHLQHRTLGRSKSERDRRICTCGMYAETV
ncbi:hypothetical protein BJ165DRAFT_333092 [Panaeolus papilionaceus]|nr:hypothetical protein BJ165DRAFT_333092 [Panaeolus papilionaceus]